MSPLISLPWTEMHKHVYFHRQNSADTRKYSRTQYLRTADMLAAGPSPRNVTDMLCVCVICFMAVVWLRRVLETTSCTTTSKIILSNTQPLLKLMMSITDVNLHFVSRFRTEIFPKAIPTESRYVRCRAQPKKRWEFTVCI